MAENIEIKVSYVRVTEYGLEAHRDEFISNLNSEDRKDVKSLSFLPIIYDGILDITEYLKDFAILETLNLPSMMTTTMDKAKKHCPLIKQIIALSRNTFEQNIAGTAVRVVAREEEGDNDASFSAYSTTDKEGKTTIVLNPVHIDNHEIVVDDRVVERLTLAHVEEYVSGEKGLMSVIEEINASIEDPRCRIDIGKEILENLLQLFVEKGLTFEQFTIDFSKLYDKIESYKSIARSVNQVSIKEEVETCIIETYQRVQQLMYENMLVEHAELLPKLVAGATVDTENMLLADLSRYVVNLITLSPKFDDGYKEGNVVVECTDENGGKYVVDYTPGIVTLPVTPGSVVKGASMLVGYKYGAIDIGTVMTDECIKIKDTPEKCSWKTMGDIDDLYALRYSSNVYQYKIAIKEYKRVR